MIVENKSRMRSSLTCISSGFSSVLKQVSSFLLCPVVCKTAWFEVLSNKFENKGECSRGKQTFYDEN